MVPLHVIDQAVERIRTGTLTGVVYDPQLAQLVSPDLAKQKYLTDYKSLNENK